MSHPQHPVPDPLQHAPLAYEDDHFINSPDGRIFRILAEYSEPLARFRKERVQDTVVFFGSARFIGMDAAEDQMRLLENTGSAKLAPEEEQPAFDGEETSELKKKRTEAAIEMARYYEDARTLARQSLVTLRGQLQRTIARPGSSLEVRAHLAESIARIDEALKAGMQRTAF